MDFFPRTFGEGLEARMTGPGKARLVVQPLIGIALGIRDGIEDAKQGRPPYFIQIVFEGERRRDVLKTSLRQISIPFAVGIILDAVLQWVIFQSIFWFGAVLTGTILIALPYAIARGLANRIVRWRKSHSAARAHRPAS
jgi:hypothetical protein